MQDPNPANITGQKVQKHTFEHSIRWDYLLAAVAVIYIASKVFGSSRSTDEESEGDLLEGGTEIDFEAAQEVTGRT